MALHVTCQQIFSLSCIPYFGQKLLFKTSLGLAIRVFLAFEELNQDQYDRPHSTQFFAGLPDLKHGVPSGRGGCSRGIHNVLAPIASPEALFFFTSSSTSSSSHLQFVPQLTYMRSCMELHVALCGVVMGQ